MIARICVVAFVVLGLGSAGAEVSQTVGAAGQQWQQLPDESTPNAPPSECNGSLKSGPSLDDPNVDTDPERPITEYAGDDGDQSDDDADGLCRSETLELWHQPDGEDATVQAMLESGRRHS